MLADYEGHSVVAFIVAVVACAVIGATVMGIVAYNNGDRGTDLLKSIAAGASIGLLISGATMSVGAVIAGAIGGAGVTFLGASVAQIFAIGALSVDTVSFIIAPLFGIVDATGIEWEPLPAYGLP